MRKFLFVLAALALVSLLATASFAGDATTVNGWVSDSKCGVKGAHEGAAECTKKCIGEGAKVVAVSDALIRTYRTTPSTGELAVA